MAVVRLWLLFLFTLFASFSFAKPKVTVIIPIYNDLEGVERAVNSILAQTHQELEIFVVDDHSNQDVYLRLVQKLEGLKDPRLHLLRLNQNVGLYALKNYVIKNFATGEFVTAQDSDDYSHPEKLQRQIEHSERYHLDAVGVQVLRINPDGSKKVLYIGFPDIRPPSLTQPFLDENRYVSPNVPSEHRTIFRTEYTIRLGGFDGRRRIEGDSDFAARFARMFPTGAINGEPLYYWVRRAQSLTTSSATGFSGKKWWLGNRRIPSWLRFEAIMAKHLKSVAANFFYHLGQQDGFLNRVIQDLYYPRSLSVESYQGHGLPHGAFQHITPKYAENRRWWRNHISSVSAAHKPKQIGAFCSSGYRNLSPFVGEDKFQRRSTF